MKIESTFHVYSGAQGFQKAGLKFLVLGQTMNVWGYLGVDSAFLALGFPVV